MIFSLMMKTRLYHDQMLRIAKIYSEGNNESYKEENIPQIWRYRLYKRRFNEFDTPVETVMSLNNVHSLDSSKMRTSPVSLIKNAMLESLDTGKYSNLMNLRQLQEKTLKYLLLAQETKTDIENGSIG